LPISLISQRFNGSGSEQEKKQNQIEEKKNKSFVDRLPSIFRNNLINRLLNRYHCDGNLNRR
jgi:hypothetical protein